LLFNSIQLLNLIPDTVIIVDDKAEVIWVNNNITDLLGYLPDELLGKLIEPFVLEETNENNVHLQDLSISEPNKSLMKNESRRWAIHKYNNKIPVFVNFNYIEEATGVFTVYTIRRLSEQELIVPTMQELHKSLEYSQSLAHVGSWDLDLINQTLVWSDETYRIFGVKPTDFKVTYGAFLCFIHHDDKEFVIAAIKDRLNNGTPFDIKHRIIRPCGEIRHVWEQGRVICDKNSKPTRVIGAVLDITELNHSDEKLKKTAYYDEITKLPNRVLCREEIENRIFHARSNNKKFAILYIDLDDFKNINNTQGHIVGDEFIHDLAQKLLTVIPNGTFLGRFDGDEFFIITDYSDDEEKIKNKVISLAKLLLLSTQIKKKYANITIDITSSIGIALYPSHGDSITSLLSSADKAMYQVKNTGKNHYAMYHANIEQKKLRELKLISDMRAGLAAGEFTVHYQAKQNLETDELVGCEALIRWQHPLFGNIPPLEFISVAESSGLIMPLGKLVLEQSCLFIKKWQTHSDKPLVVSVNVSAFQLKAPLFKEEVLQVINEAGIRGHDIELEVTESLLMENIEHTIKLLHELKKIGISLSIDDFGTGYSSLSYLQKLPVDTLKIDKSFIDLISDSASDEDIWIVQNTIALARGLKMKTVAEGVETQIQKSILFTLGCDTLQGYLYSKPISENVFFNKFADSNLKCII
jgi:diguanylate cyclase (GGDEF)-like protein/PAS domain S-box-containing protein